ncbi:LysE family translocator [Thauera aromatica]|uniref:LysE family translocator n=1 Tax=Thauera aromatica TaxID=59405 RepID=UPI001FFDDD97|nr:LysE family translocator [Thauera aromatica]MCK2089708.1 LysE family translocator [Thauera aromatica]
MLDFDTALAFLGISFLITLAPGPDNLMVLGQSLARGRMAGFGIALGCALGCFTHTLWAALGVSAALASSPTAFLALKLAGAAYLAWIGINALRHAAAVHLDAAAPQPPAPWHAYLRRGFIANAINPKVALFFLAFLPQFVRPADGAASVQMAQLGLLFAAQTVLIFGALAFAAGGIGRLLARRPGAGAWLERIAGLLFIGLALRLVVDDAPLPAAAR